MTQTLDTQAMYQTQAHTQIQFQLQPQNLTRPLDENMAQEERKSLLQEASASMPEETLRETDDPSPDSGPGDQQDLPEEAAAGPLPQKTGKPGQKRRTKAAKKTLRAFVEDIYLPHMRLRKRSWTVDARLASRFIYPTFGNREIRNIRAIEVERWLDRLTNKLAPSSCNRVLAVFKTICSLAVRQGIVPASASPCSGVFSLKLQTPRERYLSPDEAVRLMTILEQSERQEAQALRLLLLTGARKRRMCTWICT